MDLLNGKIKPLYFKCLSAAFGSAMITSVYQGVSSFPRAFAMRLGQTVSECGSESCPQRAPAGKGLVRTWFVTVGSIILDGFFLGAQKRRLKECAGFPHVAGFQKVHGVRRRGQ